MFTETESAAGHTDWYYVKTKIWTWEWPDGNEAVQYLKEYKWMVQNKCSKSSVIQVLGPVSIELGVIG